MKNVLCAAAIAVIVPGCAAPQPSTGVAASAPSGASTTFYCAKDRLNANGAQLECNWQPTIDEACSLTKSSVLDRASLNADPQPAGRCSSGVWLVKATSRA